MYPVLDLLQAIDDLRPHASQEIDEGLRLIMEGDELSASVRERLLSVFNHIERLGIESPMLKIVDTGDTIDAEDLSTSDFDGEPWRLILGKTPIAGRLRARGDETTLLFFSVNGFQQWLINWDPCLYPTGNIPDFAKPVTIRVQGLSQSVGGPLLWVMPPGAPCPSVETISLPESKDVHGLIHTNATRGLRVCTMGYALTWGDLENPEVAPLVKLSSMVLSVCLVQELRCIEGRYEATLKGTKRISMPLYDEDQIVSAKTLKILIEAVLWVYEERPETRLSLVMDRLSIDIEREQSLLSGMENHLEAALYQARDSYAFVILERKDAYHKEVRELMKDMKSHADLYAAKVRELVNSLTRDALGILFFVAFSFIAKFDKNNFEDLLVSAELAFLVKVLSCYLLLSFVLQLAAHWRDVLLADQESKAWLDVLQHYSSQADKQNRFLQPIDKRRRTFYFFLFITGCAYLLLAWATWNLPKLIEPWIG
ncbi:hypothetical protein [Vreelandella lionensis]|uniref:hypothetical protein n=1 Tax=Vreelandella lionensis TaxID=1144478 RepID=UPI0009F56A42|nr:hypothetical protein [Halomonas lionensis]